MMQLTSSKKPLIGITCGEVHNKIDPWSPIVLGQSQTYVNSVIAAGGTPLILPMTTEVDVLLQLGELLDGLCLAGGNDLSPELYGQTSVTDPTDYSKLRDTTEQILLKQALDAQKPILGICRGMQLMNVHFGGNLQQELAGISELDHDGSSKLKTLEDLSHVITIEPNSKLAAIIGKEPIGANAHHHQAIRTVGQGIQTVGWASDGVIEAIEMTEYPYGVGVQAHPESLTRVEPRWALLFASFITAAQNNAS